MIIASIILLLPSLNILTHSNKAMITPFIIDESKEISIAFFHYDLMSVVVTFLFSLVISLIIYKTNFNRKFKKNVIIISAMMFLRIPMFFMFGLDYDYWTWILTFFDVTTFYVMNDSDGNLKPSVRYNINKLLKIFNKSI